MNKRKKITKTGKIMMGGQEIGRTDARKTRDKRKRTKEARKKAYLKNKHSEVRG